MLQRRFVKRELGYNPIGRSAIIKNETERINNYYSTYMLLSEEKEDDLCSFKSFRICIVHRFGMSYQKKRRCP